MTWDDIERKAASHNISDEEELTAAPVVALMSSNTSGCAGFDGSIGQQKDMASFLLVVISTGIPNILVYRHFLKKKKKIHWLPMILVG